MYEKDVVFLSTLTDLHNTYTTCVLLLNERSNFGQPIILSTSLWSNAQMFILLNENPLATFLFMFQSTCSFLVQFDSIITSSHVLNACGVETFRSHVILNETNFGNTI